MNQIFKHEGTKNKSIMNQEMTGSFWFIVKSIARHSVFRYVEGKSKAPALHKPGGLFLTGRSLETTPSNGQVKSE